MEATIPFDMVALTLNHRGHDGEQVIGMHLVVACHHDAREGVR
jgi:hypothetical protein